MKKFELTSEFVVNIFGIKLFKIKALIKFGDVDAGELGGYIEKEENVDQSGNAWVSGNAQVYGNAWVSGDAWVYGDAQVSGNAQVYGNARVSGDAWVYGDARVSGNAQVEKSTHLFQLGALGSRDGFTTFFRVKAGQIHVVCGCFYGDIDKFEEAVHKTHAGTKHEKAYMLAIALAKSQIELDEVTETAEE
ncbi:hypothetical protein [Desulfosporosinus youngiae]|uniref:Uncharacterized protein n=1 Tax=Desulfosporosinus youngiae DSM 17734 TaxID=768710 RepID=H5Y240_9FIRM|nr:hypothetical protein [Desulfosporosinus youngiae]EHQ88238.1 hypothetical protein DesyoDRAFT_1067 [Desulfosporosinus youngiae DSM 17734]